MYRNCVYDNKKKAIILFTWNEDGERVTQEIPFSPYVMYEDTKGTYKSIYGTRLKKKEFATQWDRYRFVKESGFKKLYENLPAYQQFLVDNYYHCNNDVEFSQYPLRIMFMDIECPGNPDLGQDEFPNIDDPEYEINVMTCYDSFTKQYTIFGLKEYTPKRDDVTYVYCKTEKKLLKSFMDFYCSDYPDVMIGYNSAGFDFPYLANRIRKVLGDGEYYQLSPVGRVYDRVNKQGKFGKPSKEVTVEGVSYIDMFNLYRKFNMEPQENYKLDYIAELELDEGKVSYDGNLWELSVNDWDRYCEYNLVDVELLVKLENKLKYIDLLRFVSTLGLSSMEKAIDTVPIVTGAIAIQARRRGVYIPTFLRTPKNEEKIPGGYVSDPVVGISKNVVSFDANSLYPSVMISLNLSPETKIGRVEPCPDGNYYIYHVNGRRYEMTPSQLVQYFDEEKIAIAKNDFLFTQKSVGIVPEFLDLLYAKRKEMKGKMIKCKSDHEYEKAKMFDTIQNAYKIVLNSTYGYFVNSYAPLVDKDIGSAVTLTGQAVIKKSVDIMMDYVKGRMPDATEESLNNIYKYSDTDSIYMSMSELEKIGVKLIDENTGKISKEFFEECESFEKYLNKEIGVWATKALNSKDSRFVFKREAICDKAIFICSKYYVLHVLNNEGVDDEYFKYKGVDVVKTTIPKSVKPYIKDVIETLIMTEDKELTNKKFLVAYDEYKKLGPDSVYEVSTLNNYKDWCNKCNGFETAKMMPFHLKAAWAHDLVIDDAGLKSKYEKFRNGDKIKMVPLKKNRYGVSKIGFKNKWPTEFNEIFAIDFESMFGKIIYKPIDRFFQPIGWLLRKPNENLKVELEDLLS